MKLAPAVLASSLLVGCATVPPAERGAEDIFHYSRTNIDGSEPEHVVHFRPARTQIAVYKWVEKCTNAAYVTAEMDAAVREGRRYVAGKVARDGTQASFGTLTLDPGGPALAVDITPPGGPRLQQREKLRSRPFILYDFDFADLNAFLQEHRPRNGFRFALPVIWPGEGGSLFRDYGTLVARFAGNETRLGRATAKFLLSVEGAQPSSGALWIDARRNFIVEAELGLPNHQEYRDFRLRLDRIQPGGQSAWDAMTRAHYAGCPTGN